MENKYQEAFNNFKKLKYIPNAFNLTMNITLLEKDINTFQELIDKETPKKVKQFKNSRYVRLCPSCECTLESSNNYCCECGQKLDWSEEDE